jgi:tetracycline 7-halogenase / FADH2 O2-dependent halogenase
LSQQYDIAIIGSGFAGSLLAMIARRLGRSVVLIERGKHPRMVIGESSTPLTNLLLEDLTTRYDLPALKPLSKWGTWQQAHPEVACGLKRGFTFYHHNLDHPQSFPPDRDHQLLVAASPHDAIADTHWYRADFDHLFVREAQKLGVTYLDETTLTGITQSDNEVSLTGTRQSRTLTLSAKFVVDASGSHGFLHRALNLGESALPYYPTTQTLYSHFTGVGRIGSSTQDQPPYPPDSAAVHHIFDGGWIWLLHFNNGVTSAGIAATDALASRWNLAEGAAAWDRILRDIPALRKQFATAKPVQPFRHIPRLGFRSATITGKRWALLPSAAGFVDPLLSTGFPLTLLGIDRLATIIEHDWESPRFAQHLETYAAEADAELLATARLIGSLYANMDNFPVFVSLSLLYFAIASYSETVRRLNKPYLAPSFLLHDHPQFGPSCIRLFERARQLPTTHESTQLSEDILRAIEPFNVAGLGKADRRNWYPVEAQDLLDSAPKLDATREDIQQLLHRCGF